MTVIQKDILEDTRDTATGNSGEALWKKFLDTTSITKVNISVDYHCCDIFTLLARFYAKRIEPTCIFMVIGTLIILLLLKLL
jgi:hypothetical protein